MRETQTLTETLAHAAHRNLLWLLIVSYAAAALLPGPGLWLRAVDLTPFRANTLGLHVSLPAALLSLLLFNALKLIGAAYLLWLGWKMLRARPSALGAAAGIAPLSTWAALRTRRDVEVWSAVVLVIFLLQFGFYGLLPQLPIVGVAAGLVQRDRWERAAGRRRAKEAPAAEPAPILARHPQSILAGAD